MIEIINNNMFIKTDNLLISSENIGIDNVGMQEFWKNVGTHAS